MKRDTLLLIDDMEVNRAILRELFEQEYNLLEAENGEQAFMLIKQYKDSLAAVLLDLVMPVKDGYQVMTEMTKNGLMASIPVIVITSEESMENEVRAFDMGAADIIIKPFEPHVVRRRVQNAVDLNRHKMYLEEMVEEQSAKLRESREVLMDTLSSIIEHRSVETGQHVLRIRMFTKVLLEEVMRCCPQYDLNEHSISVIAEASALHDIGKISIPDTILNKPGRLTDEEFAVMKTHTTKGCEILSGLDRMDDKEYLLYAHNICRYHHERWDGKGYPDGLREDNTPICAQAVGIADAYDALTTDRVYKKAIPPEKALTMILNGECGNFSPRLLECLKTVREQFFALSRKYADGHSPKADSKQRPANFMAKNFDTRNAPELNQMKYFTMLRYVDSTVMEVDMNSGIYHVVYQKNEDFQDLRSGDTFEESIQAFAERAVYPEDRGLVLEILSTYIEDFFTRGMIKRSRKYRVLHRATGAYVWYEATALRVDIDNPNRHKVLFIWTPLEQYSEALPQPEITGAPLAQNLLVGVIQTLNDQWFTLTYMNEGFITLLDYSREEIEQEFHSRFIEMIHTEDKIPVRRRFLKQLSTGSSQELEYRIVTKDGNTIWVLDKCQVITGQDGQEYLNCVLMDITQIKRVEEELRLSMERYRIIQDQTDDIIFESDLISDEITYSSNWVKIFGYKPISTKIREQLRTASHILPGDIPAFENLIDDITGGVPYREAEVRIADKDGRYLWCRIRVTAQFDAAGTPVKAVGVIMNIDGEKRRTQELSSRAERDALTKLYNKAAAREKIQWVLQNREQAQRFAMLLIDLDNFKQINDIYGHMFGDAVLEEAAACLKRILRDVDITARFGGDEFLVVVPYEPDEAHLYNSASKIIEAIHNVFADSLQNCRLTCSIGISYCPEQVLTAGTRIESDAVLDYSIDSIVPQSFQKLYESGDIVTAIQEILEMVGRRFNVSRAYIFENSEDGAYSANTFEWCNEGIRPEISNLQNISYQELGGHYGENFNENGIFYCQDISGLPKEQYEMLAHQGVRSLLQCAIRDGGKFVGFVGFDDCLMLRKWTHDQIHALTFVAELLSTFLLKKRAQDRVLRSERDLRMILDNQNAWIYVIDPDTYKLLYINVKTQQDIPDAGVGTHCYEAFFHRNTPCEQCPVRGLQYKGDQMLEIYNPILDIWSMVDACLIRWGDKTSCLLSCHDITKYKTSE